MQYQAILLEIKDDIAVITLNRPDVLNALNAQIRAELLDAYKRVQTEARVVVLTGAGRAFCAGQDLGGNNVAHVDLERTLRDEYLPLLDAIYNSTIPTIHAVNGPAVGAGANIALAADVVVASEAANFMQAFTRIGLIPDAGGTYWLPRQIGFPRAMGAALFAEPISARQAADWGMIWEAVPEDTFEATWRARAKHLAQGPTETYARVKQALRGGMENDLLDQLELESKLQGECGKTHDFQEGVLAFLEKRQARFEGR